MSEPRYAGKKVYGTEIIVGDVIRPGFASKQFRAMGMI